VDLRLLSEQKAFDGASTRRIVVGFDDSPSAAFTLEWAAREAVARRCALDVLGPEDSLLRAGVGADLMIIGASTPAAARAALFASAPPTARRSACPLVVVRGRRRDAMRRIVVGVDGSNAAEAASDWAFDEADRHGASVTVLHASPLVLVGASGHTDLLVIGSRGRSGFRTMLFGSSAIAVVEHARCPVAVIHPHVRPAR
jgi:nucleotide-binding universal stress UspA family protein